MHKQWAFGKLHNCCTKVVAYVWMLWLVKVCCVTKSPLYQLVRWTVFRLTTYFLALVTHEYWSVITCHEIWQKRQGGLGTYTHHLWEIFTYWPQSKIVELERMIPRSLHTIKARDQEICDIMGGGDCVLALNLFKQVPFPAFMKDDACLKKVCFLHPECWCHISTG